MTDKLPDVWTNRDYPVLIEVARRLDTGPPPVTVQQVTEATGLTSQDVIAAGKALSRRGLVEVGGTYAEAVHMFLDVSGDAYLLAGLHPSGDDALSSLADALRQAADQVEDPAEKSRLRAAADGLLNVSRGVAASVMTAWITKQIGAT